MSLYVVDGASEIGEASSSYPQPVGKEAARITDLISTVKLLWDR